MSNNGRVPPLIIARRVTRKHGEAFAQKWREMQSGEIASEAFGKSDLIEWPDDNLLDPLDDFSDPRQERFHDITDEIAERTFDAVRPAVADAFVRIAREVLDRERKRK